MKKIIVLDSNQIVDELKLIVSATLSHYHDALASEILPIIEEESREEYQKVILQCIKDVEMIKEEIFSSIVSSYNEFLQEKFELEKMVTKENKESNELIETATQDMKRGGIIAAGAALLYPPIIPFLVILETPRFYLDYRVKKRNSMQIEVNELLQEEYKKIQTPFFEFTTTLRNDYFKSKKDLSELRERLLAGNKVDGNLLEIISPERINLEKIDIQALTASGEDVKVYKK